MKKRIIYFEDLEVYQRLCQLHIIISELTFKFPEFELHETGSELRKSSSSAPAYIAECYNNKNSKIYLEGISKVLRVISGTKHYLNIAFKKKYIEKTQYLEITNQYDECIQMVKTLEKSINSRKARSSIFTKNQFRESYHL